MNIPMIAVVMPCLNEERDLAATCLSLGFGKKSNPDALLILVDNGSTDRTIEVARDVQRSSGANSVILVQEPTQGYVPARAKGAKTANEIARGRGISDSGVLLVQADADTRYEDGYIGAIASDAVNYGHGLLFEGVSDWPVDFMKEHEGFVTYLQTIDTGPDLGYLQQFDVVVDDKCCGYWLSDYLSWGGHRREYTRFGEEIYAETTRLFMRAVARGSRRHQVTRAIARHSVRRWSERPLREFASAGFPRETSWYLRWESAEQLVDGLPSASAPLTAPWDVALAERRRHSAAFFEVLPRLVARSIGQWHAEGDSERDCGIAARTCDELADSPGLFIEDVFSLIDNREPTLPVKNP